MDVKINVNSGIKDVYLYQLPVALRVTEFDMNALNTFAEDFNKAINSGQSVIPIYINSYGGAIDALMGMIDIIDEAPVPVATVCVGAAMSCGSVLLSSGTKGYRFAGPSSRIMVHDAAIMMHGKENEVKYKYQEFTRFKHQFLNILDDNCEKERGYWLSKLKEIDNADLYLSPNEAKQHGLIDRFGVPKLSANVDLSYKFE